MYVEKKEQKQKPEVKEKCDKIQFFVVISIQTE